MRRLLVSPVHTLFILGILTQFTTASAHAVSASTYDLRIAYSTIDGIYTANTDGTAIETLFVVNTDTSDGLPIIFPKYLAYHPVRNEIYYSTYIWNMSLSTINSVTLDGLAGSYYLAALDNPNALAIDPGRDIVAYGEFGGVVLGSWPPVASDNNADVIALDPLRSKIYWTVADDENWDGEVIDYDGANRQQLPGVKPVGFAVEISTGTLYWTSHPDTVFRQGPNRSVTCSAGSGVFCRPASIGFP